MLTRTLIFAWTLTLVSAAYAAVTADVPSTAIGDAAGMEFFEKNIRPVLADKCYGCHSADSGKQKGGLALDTREGIRMGGDSGHAVVPGNVKESLLLRAVGYASKDMQMPPKKEGGKLPAEVIAKFEQWVAMGAPDPRATAGGKPAVRKSWDIAEGRKFWAFQAPVAAAAPVVKDTAWPRGEVDRFLLAAQEAKGIYPVADAEPRALVRRIYFDVIGLPPTPEQVAVFLKDPSQAGVARTVDALMATPQFGERWGRHWLDVARYAESSGKESNQTFPAAWRYRDWVIAAVNADKPYDRFIREQIAGDLLPHATPEERDALLVATGFLALGTKSLNEKNKAIFQSDLVDEQIDATTRAVLATSLACARCHDHKFDPIPQRDYYAMAGIFKSSATYYGTGGQGARNRNASSLIPLTPAVRVDSASVAAPARVPAPAVNRASVLAALAQKNPKAAARFKAMSPAQQAAVIERRRAKSGAPATTAPAAVAVAKGKPGKAGKGGMATQKADPSNPACMGVLEGRPADARLLVRGEVDQPGESVPRGFISVLTNGDVPAMPATGSGRAQLAEWLASMANPLTSRVAVNRVWQQLFGEGLVGTEDNFGANGERPIHPELLDFLAVKFQTPRAQGGMAWSVKGLVRTLILTRAYQLGSAHESFANELDPDNRLVWRQTPRRLDAEAIRDAMLAAGGQLQLAQPQGSLVAMIGDGAVGRGLKAETFTGYQSKNRSVYLPIVRDGVPEVLDVFDFAEPSLVIAAREVTNVPSQALFLLNSPFVREQSLALARRVLATPLDFPARIHLAYQTALGRPASEAEFLRAHAYLLSEARGLISEKNSAKDPAAEAAWGTLCQALFACAEFRYLR